MSIRGVNMAMAGVAFQRVCETFSSGLEFLTPEKKKKNLKKRKKENKPGPCHRVSQNY